jgi:hydroxypyruvate isomerase
MLRFSANLGFLWRDLPLLDAIGKAKAAGFDAVEFHYPYNVRAETMAALLADLSLPVVCLNTRPGNLDAGDLGLCAVPGREAEARAAIEEAIAYGQAIGAGSVHVMAGRPHEGGSGKARETYLAALDHAAGLAESAGMAVLIEPLNPRDASGYFLNSSQQAAAIIEELRRSNIKLLFDCYHTQINEGDLTRRFERLLPVIGHVQIAAVPSRAEPDEGELAYERFLQAVEAAGYEGYIGAEYRPRGTVEDGLGWLSQMRASST